MFKESKFDKIVLIILAVALGIAGMQIAKLQTEIKMHDAAQ